MDRPNFGITAIAQELMWVLAAKCFPIILGKVNEKLNALSQLIFLQRVLQSS
ncbi:hypothetical protein KSP39_PZI020616 [Platanthera zijinensis]|uniref:Uncharacterized protein n=1 Tax=Platanthera zijinensis TaxID=2320716 RepID=A0AAP0AZU7_9ASPA